MNDRDLELADQCTAQEFSDCTGFSETFDKAKFAELIRADEREACAKVCDDFAKYSDWPTTDNCAAVIRARGDK